MKTYFSILLLVACSGLCKCQSDPDVGAALDAVAPAKPPCSCILPIVLLPGSGLGGLGLLPGGVLNNGILSGLLSGGILNNNNVNLALLKLLALNPALLQLPGLAGILNNALLPGAAPAAGAVTSDGGLLNNLAVGGILNSRTGYSLPVSNGGVLNNAVYGGILNG